MFQIPQKTSTCLKDRIGVFVYPGKLEMTTIAILVVGRLA
jgi:hypothetical protein